MASHQWVVTEDTDSLAGNWQCAICGKVRRADKMPDAEGCKGKAIVSERIEITEEQRSFLTTKAKQI